MNITEYAIQELAKSIKDLKKGREWVALFDKYGAKDVYDEIGLPDIGKRNSQRPSKVEYIKARFAKFNTTTCLRDIIVQIVSENPDIIDSVNNIIKPEGYNVIYQDNQYILLGDFKKDNHDNKQAEINAHFLDIQNNILHALDKARVSIVVVMAWFTNEVIAEKLIKKRQEGLDVKVAIYDDGVNNKYGVNLKNVPLYRIRSKHGGIMHNKFCVIDNQIVITGSYNWTNNAEFRNEENISIIEDNNTASDYSVKFRDLVSPRDWNSRCSQEIIKWFLV